MVTSSVAKTKASSLDSDYLAALATANRFLYAWQSQDQESCLIMLTEAAKRHTSEDRLETDLAPGSAVERAYEIARGQKLRHGLYSFPLVLLESKNHKPVHRRFSQIIVTRAGKEDWAVDKLP